MAAGSLGEVWLPGVPSSVAVARRCAAAMLTAAGHVYLDDALLVLSELATNAVLHTRAGLAYGTFRVRVADLGEEEEGVLIEVIDPEAWSVPEARRSEETAHSGRGLPLVDSLSLRWGVRAKELSAGGGFSGKGVWAEVQTVCAPAAVGEAAESE
jgi:anti-sigma regulatory factor (Ser/Thr protein kinase)